ncbi:hypothetical protein L0F63_006940 [Massospora cicadina]|nr:hypothetical protein L0F63_006940 [Massospora cicadina]
MVLRVTFDETQSFGTLASNKSRTGSIGKSNTRKDFTPPGALEVEGGLNSSTTEPLAPKLPRTPYPKSDIPSYNLQKPADNPHPSRFWYGLYSPANGKNSCKV